jgi:3-deoxy-D-manno-octulosonate 8-phosphate phosphatase (KDO 8-P phosphatase)
MENAAQLARVKMVVLNVDGILTDGCLWQDSLGRARRSFSVRDAMALKTLKKAGIRIALFVSGNEAEIREHARAVGVDVFRENCADRQQAIWNELERQGLVPAECAIVTLDEVEAQIANEAGAVVLTLANANVALDRYAHLRTSRSGGDAAVMEISARLRTAHASEELSTTSQVPQLKEY